MRRLLVCVGMISLCACAGDALPEDEVMAAWQVERSTDGDVTTVRNLAGSKWGGQAVLVEELSIGVLEGDEEYMLGRVSTVAVSEEFVFVADSQPALIKVYDRASGEFVRTVGGEGEGPGEYVFPSVMRVVGDELFVQDGGNGRIQVFSTDGEYRRQLRLDALGFLGGFVVAADGRAYMQSMLFLDDEGQQLPADEQRWGFHEVDDEGTVGDPFYAPGVDMDRSEFVMRSSDGRFGATVPYAPGVPNGISTAPAVVDGWNGTYAFNIHYPDGRRVSVDRHWTPVPISSAERESLKAQTIARVRRRAPDWEWTGPEVPETKPAYASIIPDHGSLIMIVRHVASERGDDCVEKPTTEDFEAGATMCWQTRYTWDFFDHDGNYLGEVVRPNVRIMGWPYIRDDTFGLAVDDDDGAVRVKVYRRRLPSDGRDS
ncbi:MAG: 6-bladed beta-propeller [Acidobacteria bacterium]|nr:6-bladed beta-propeller [Acidobacteriota bacterium]